MSEWNEELTALSDGYAAKVEENAYFQACSEVLQLRAEIERLQAERRWIPVSERLPEYGHAVLIMTTTSVVPRIGVHSPTIPQWATTDGLYYHGNTYSLVTHWQEMTRPDAS
jgi:hypothetical protein